MNEFRPFLIPLLIVILAVDSLLYGAAFLEFTAVVFAAGALCGAAVARFGERLLPPPAAAEPEAPGEAR
jgi:hypothetical protein